MLQEPLSQLLILKQNQEISHKQAEAEAQVAINRNGFEKDRSRHVHNKRIFRKRLVLARVLI